MKQDKCLLYSSSTGLENDPKTGYCRVNNFIPGTKLAIIEYPIGTEIIFVTVLKERPKLIDAIELALDDAKKLGLDVGENADTVLVVACQIS